MISPLLFSLTSWNREGEGGKGCEQKAAHMTTTTRPLCNSGESFSRKAFSELCLAVISYKNVATGRVRHACTVLILL